MGIVERKYSSLFLSLFATFLLFGLTSTVIGAALPTMLADFGWSYGMAGSMLAAGALGSFLSSFVAGKASDRFGARAVLAAGFALCSLSLALFGATTSPLLNTALYFVLGFGQALLEVGVNWCIIRMDEKGSGGPMSVMHGAFSVGAVAGPFSVGILLGARLSWTAVYRAAAVLFLALFGLMFLLPFKRLRKIEAASGRGKARAGKGILALGFVALLFYVGTELGLSNWSAEYFVKRFGLGAASASFVVSAFWGGLALGRFGIPLVLKRARPDRLILALSLGLAAGTAVLALLGSAGPAATGFALAAVVLSGFAASAIYPSVVTILGKAYESDPGPAIGLGSAGGSLGSLVFPFAMSGIAAAKGVQAGFVFYALLALLCFGSCAALFAALGKRGFRAEDKT
jgi:fucose permease